MPLPDFTFDAWRARLLAVNSRSRAKNPQRRAPQLMVHKEGSLSAYYAPFFREVTGASVALVGLTPGFRQWTEAVLTAQTALQSGRSDDEVAREVQQVAAFGGSMRTNMVEMLNDLGLAKALGLESFEQAFERDVDLHMTSLLRLAVFRNEKNYSGTPRPSKHSFLRELVLNVCGPELARVQPRLIVPLGKAVEDGLGLLVESGVVSEKQVLWGFPHPSGANGHRKEQFAANRASMKRTVRRVALR